MTLVSTASVTSIGGTTGVTAPVRGAVETARMSAVRRRTMPGSYTRSAEIPARTAAGSMTCDCRPAHRTARRDSTAVQCRMTAKPAFPGRPDVPRTAAVRMGMIEGVTAECASMSELPSHWMATGETAAPHHVDRRRVVSERQIDGRSTPYSGNDARPEDGAAKVDAIVIAPAHAEARIPGFAPAQRDPAYRIDDADDRDVAHK